MKLKGKFWGSYEAVDTFRKYVENNFIGFTSPVRDSEQGDCHCYFTIEVRDKN